MRRVLLSAVAASALLVSSAASAQDPGTRDGWVDQAVSNTVYQSLKRQGYNNPTASTLGVMGGIAAAIQDSAANDVCVKYASGSAPASTWGRLITCFLAYPFVAGLGGDAFQKADGTPLYAGKGFPGDGGSYGGGGASGTGWNECGDVKYALDADGNLIIPSMFLKTGGPIDVAGTWMSGGTPYYGGENLSSPRDGPHMGASSGQAYQRRRLHLQQLSLDPRHWKGVIGVAGDGYCDFASVAWRDANGTLWPRTTSRGLCSQDDGYFHYKTNDLPDHVEHKRCPEQDAPGADIYASGETSHIHQCIIYFPNQEAGWKGYAINPQTTVSSGQIKNWPVNLPDHLLRCRIDPEMLRKIAQKLWEKAAARPGYTGPPVGDGVKIGDVRPGDTKIADLRDVPNQTPASPTQPDPNAPPPTLPPTTTPPASGYKDECDFGATGCTDPGKPEPTLGEAPTGIMDPIFDWLPDLPSITLNYPQSECPVWTIDARDFGGTNWIWLMDAQCSVAEQARAPLSLLMPLLFSFGAAMVLLRA